MAYDKYRKTTTETVKETVPEGVDVTSVEFEGPYVVIYTKTLDLFAEDGEIVRKLAQTLRRRGRWAPMDKAVHLIAHLLERVVEVFFAFLPADDGPELQRLVARAIPNLPAKQVTPIQVLPPRLEKQESTVGMRKAF